jgi:hypothetical protein
MGSATALRKRIKQMRSDADESGDWDYRERHANRW